MAVVHLPLAQCMAVLFLMAITITILRGVIKQHFLLDALLNSFFFFSCCIMQILYSLLLSTTSSWLCKWMYWPLDIGHLYCMWVAKLGISKEISEGQGPSARKMWGQNSWCKRSYNHLTRVKLSMLLWGKLSSKNSIFPRFFYEVLVMILGCTFNCKSKVWGERLLIAKSISEKSLHF